MAKTEFEQKIYDDVKNQKGTSFTIHASLLERLLVKKTSVTNLHPNADDEFTFEDIGPSFKIIGEYEEKFRYALRHNQPVFDDALPGGSRDAEKGLFVEEHDCLKPVRNAKR